MALNPISKPLSIDDSSYDPRVVQIEDLGRMALALTDGGDSVLVATAVTDPITEGVAYWVRILTTDEVARWMELNPKVKRFYVNARGQYVRRWIEEYEWTVDSNGTVSKVPKEWPEVPQ